MTRKIKPLLLLALLFLGACSSRDEGAADSGDDPVTVTVRFKEDVTPEVMAAFFDGFNSGLVDASASRYDLSIPKKQMTVTYPDQRDADMFVFVAKKNASVADVVVGGAKPPPECPEGGSNRSNRLENCGVVES